VKLFVLVLHKEEYLEEVLSAFIELGVTGATVVESAGMGRIISHSITIFSGLKESIEVERPFNKTIFAVVDGVETTKALIRIVEKICGSLDKPGTGIAFTIPVEEAIGFVQSTQ